MADEEVTLQPPSKDYPVRVYFWTPTPQQLLTAGYNAIRLERRKKRDDPWVKMHTGAYALLIEPLKYNYNLMDMEGRVGFEYRAVLINKDTPGAPVDMPQPFFIGVDTSYEMVLTVQELKEIYLWGQDPGFITDDGQQQPDYTFVHNIKYAIDKVEKKLDIKLLPTRIVAEPHDWIPESMARGYVNLNLDKYPLLKKDGKVQFESLTLNRNGVVFTYPPEWIRVQADTGVLRVVPQGAGYSPSMGYGGAPGRGYIPDALEATYWAGWAPGEIPYDLKEIVGKEAAVGPLNVGGDLIGGAGLAGTSLGVDGLSQSVTTTNSSTNAGFGARLLMYRKELAEKYKFLIPYYKGLRLRVA